MGQAVRHFGCSAVAAGLLLCVACGAGWAQPANDEVWNPFKWLEPAPPKREAPDAMDLERAPVGPIRSGAIETSDLAPVAAPDSSGLPLGLWRGLSMADLEQLLGALDLPPRSPALHEVWSRMLMSAASPPDRASADHFAALRLEALYRSGLLGRMDEALSRSGASPLGQAILARKQIGLGEREIGCRAVRSLAGPGAALQGCLKGELQLLAGYCAAAEGDGAAAGLAANLAREEGLTDGMALQILDSLSLGTKTHPTLPARVSLLGYRFLVLLGPVDDMAVVQKAEPALLVAFAGGQTRDIRARTAAAEAALRLNALSPEAVAQIYRVTSEQHHGREARGGDPVDPVTRRAQLFRAIEATQAPELKGQLLRALLEDARRAGIHLQTAQMLAPIVAQIWPSPDNATLAEPVIEIGLAAGDSDLARRWAETSASLQHWLALIDLSDGGVQGGRLPGLARVEELASRGRLNAEVLHRLSTVVDALDMEVPMAIWEAAGRVPQPVSGYLPETGVLSELKQASQRKEVGRTVLVAMRTIGPNTADGASILALGDIIRALKRTGLEADARRLGVEALLPLWPRTQGS